MRTRAGSAQAAWLGGAEVRNLDGGRPPPSPGAPGDTRPAHSLAACVLTLDAGPGAHLVKSGPSWGRLQTSSVCPPSLPHSEELLPECGRPPSPRPLGPPSALLKCPFPWTSPSASTPSAPRLQTSKPTSDDTFPSLCWTPPPQPQPTGDTVLCMKARARTARLLPSLRFPVPGSPQTSGTWASVTSMLPRAPPGPRGRRIQTPREVVG